FGPGKTIEAGEGGAVVTNDGELYQRLLWHTQHPRRQRSELGLAMDNEFALNGRMHPLAARIGAKGWDRGMRRAAGRRRVFMSWLDELEASGQIEPLGFHDAAIAPTLPELVVP